MADLYKEALSADTTICVAPYGDDNRANGSFESPFATLAAAIAAITSTKKTIVLMPGSYTHSTATDITVNGTKIIGLGEVEIDGSGCTTYCLKTVFGATSGTKELTIKNIKLDAGELVGLQLQNTGATAKVNCYLTNVDISNDSTSYNSLDIDHAAAGECIRVYADNCSFEGPVNVVAANDSDRNRFKNCTLRGGYVSDTGAKTLEILFDNCLILHEGVTGGAAQQTIYAFNCKSETDADPNVYAALDTSDLAGSQTETVLFPAS